MKHTAKTVVRESKYRQIIVESRGASDSYRDVSPADFSSSGEAIAASASHVAYVTSAGNDIQLLSIKDTSKAATGASQEPRQTLKGHVNGPVLDLQFSLLDYSLLASGGSDGTAKVWQVGASGGGDPKCSLSGAGAATRAISQVRWHPTCASLLGLAGSSSFGVFDISNPGASAIALYDNKKDISSVCWNWTGSQAVLCTPQDKSIIVVDPRTRERACEIENAYTANKSITCEWAGSSEHQFFTTGASMTRDREVCVWDMRTADKPLSRSRVDQNSGVLRPLFDPDTKLLFLTGHGDANIRVFELEDDNGLFAIGNYIFSEGGKSACLVPKPACDVMGCEVDRVLRLLPHSIEGIRVEVPRRKAYRDFQEDIFPDTRAPVGTLTVPEYVKGESAQPSMVSVKSLAALHSTSEETAERAGKEEAEDLERTQEQEQEEQEEIDRLAEKSDQLDKRFSKFLGYQAKMKFAKVSQTKRDDSFYNLTPDCGGSDSVNIACSSKFFAVPWKGNAGPVYVGNLSKPGKLGNPTDAQVLQGHSATVNCLQFDEFDDLVLATGSDDCSVRVWKLNPDSGESETSEKMQGGHRLSVRGVNFSRICKNLLTSFGSDPCVKLWDVSTGQCLIDLDETVMGSTSACNVDWSYDASQMAIIGRDSELRMVDPRLFKNKLQHQFQAHEGLKGTRVCFLGKEPALVTTGFGKTGDRQFKLWDIRKFGGTSAPKPLATTALDAGAGVIIPYFVEDNGVLIMYAKGELAVRMYEVEGIALAHDFQEIGKQKRETKKFEMHRCAEFRALGEPTAGFAFLPRRNVDIRKAEWLCGVRLTPTMVEQVSFTVPRSQEIQGYFYDDLYPPARSAQPALTDPVAWSKKDGPPCDGPGRIDLNTLGLKVLSQRPAAEAHQALKRGVASSDKMRKDLEEQERRKREQQEVLERMQKLAVQHEQYNPNLSKPGVGHGETTTAVSGPGDVKDDEWED